ncbi:replication protein A 70 kDa DNA-binding subunit [Striga asiatica]|uniref:Replication protein A 70 kDa DNA-binding subunit n=1 Tax=Striga asiatica TaxID=4170 RepID=A0A5A7PBE2_STRAF|nr:replication protein A 70 kDa DNA-binding subunit [Striga asiatica]
MKAKKSMQRKRDRERERERERLGALLDQPYCRANHRQSVESQPSINLPFHVDALGTFRLGYLSSTSASAHLSLELARSRCRGNLSKLKKLMTKHQHGPQLFRLWRRVISKLASHQKISHTEDICSQTQKKRPMLFTLWNEFEANEGVQLSSTIPTGNIVLAMRIKVTTFNCLSLTTRLPTCILINPPMQEAVNLKQWYIEHKAEVAHLMENKAFMNASVLSPPPNDNHVVTVQAALRSLNKTLHGCKIRSPWSQTRNPYGSVHVDSHTKLEVPVGWEVKCTICQEQTNVEPRCRFVVAINDGTGVLNALIYAEDAEKLIPFTALQIYEAEKEGNNLLSEIVTGFWKKTITWFVRHYESDYGYPMDKYTIVKLYLEDEIHGEARQHARIENQVAADEHLITPTGSQIPFAGDDSPYSRMEREVEKQSAGSSTKRKLIFSGPSDSKGETNQEKSSKQHIGTSNVEEKDFNP